MGARAPKRATRQGRRVADLLQPPLPCSPKGLEAANDDRVIAARRRRADRPPLPFFPVKEAMADTLERYVAVAAAGHANSSSRAPPGLDIER